MKIDPKDIFINPDADSIRDLFAITDDEAVMVSKLFAKIKNEWEENKISMAGFIKSVIEGYEIKNLRDLVMITVTAVGIMETNRRESMERQFEDEKKFILEELPKKLMRDMKSKGISPENVGDIEVFTIPTSKIPPKGKPDGEDRIQNNSNLFDLINTQSKGGDTE